MSPLRSCCCDPEGCQTNRYKIDPCPSTPSGVDTWCFESTQDLWMLRFPKNTWEEILEFTLRVDRPGCDPWCGKLLCQDTLDYCLAGNLQGGGADLCIGCDVPDDRCQHNRESDLNQYVTVVQTDEGEVACCEPVCPNVCPGGPMGHGDECSTAGCATPADFESWCSVAATLATAGTVTCSNATQPIYDGTMSVGLAFVEELSRETSTSFLTITLRFWMSVTTTTSDEAYVCTCDPGDPGSQYEGTFTVYKDHVVKFACDYVQGGPGGGSNCGPSDFTDGDLYGDTICGLESWNLWFGITSSNDTYYTSGPWEWHKLNYCGVSFDINVHAPWCPSNCPIVGRMTIEARLDAPSRPKCCSVPEACD